MHVAGAAAGMTQAMAAVVDTSQGIAVGTSQTAAGQLQLRASAAAVVQFDQIQTETDIRGASGLFGHMQNKVF